MAAICYSIAALHDMWPSHPEPGHGHQHATFNTMMTRRHFEIESVQRPSGTADQTVDLVVLDYSNFQGAFAFSVSFGVMRQFTEVASQPSPDGSVRHLVRAPVPPFLSTQSPDENVPLALLVHDMAGNLIDIVRAGAFLYTDHTEMSSQDGVNDGQLPFEQARSPFFHQFGTTPTTPSWPGDVSTTASTATEARHGSARHSSSSARSSSARSRELSGRASSMRQGIGAQHSIRESESPVMQSTESSQKQKQTLQSKNPTLIRTSTLPAQGAQSGAPNTTTKAVLQLNGDLNSLQSDWTQQENEHNRRLVTFVRHQQGNRLTISFTPVTLEHAQRSSGVYVSCIRWPARKEAFITSVDTIYLLEAMVGNKFTVEEKNRIRRNLEGFRPQTVSKHRADSEDFFKMLMGLPKPKPRNIEKDVKVFPWRILSNALHKIIGKYSATYGPTSGLEASSSRESSLASTATVLANPSQTASSAEISRSTSPQVQPSSDGNYTLQIKEEGRMANHSYQDGGQIERYYSAGWAENPLSESSTVDYNDSVDGWAYNRQIGQPAGPQYTNPGIRFAEPYGQYQQPGRRRHPSGRQMGTGEDAALSFPGHARGSPHSGG